MLTKMEMTSLIDMLIGLVVTGGAWWANGMSREQKRVEILLNKTREDYARKDDVKDDMHNLMDALKRLEDKLDKILIGNR